ncbi:MAG: cell division protein FtsL [Mollicutes bacterium]|nr:cell division protein FtsL [Mollicutes bacterium]
MKKKTKIKFFKIEKLLFLTMICLVLLIAISTVFTKATLSRTNINVEKMKVVISKQESINQSITMKINELASLTNIQTIAKEYGLNYNNDNILVVKDN